MQTAGVSFKMLQMPRKQMTHEISQLLNAAANTVQGTASSSKMLKMRNKREIQGPKRCKYLFWLQNAARLARKLPDTGKQQDFVKNK
jgi:hypothetical protein